MAFGDFCQRPPDQRLHGARVFRRSGADKIGVLNAEQLPEIAKNLLVLVDQFLRRDAELFRGALDVHAVLVGAGEIGHVVAAHSLVARDHVADDRRVGRAHVRPRIRVVNRRGQVIFFH